MATPQPQTLEVSQAKTWSTNEAAAEVQDVLGQRIAAAAVGVSNPRQVGKWARGQGVKEFEVEERLLALVRLVEILRSRFDSPQLIRSWVLAPKADLDEASPLEVFADGDTRTVLRAARSYTA